MVKAELSYNPYLLETSVRFNGRKPYINSLIEKHRQEILQDWINEIPSIFHDEMNGYGFELEFSGTKTEYEDLIEAFARAGVTENMVYLFHKNELDDRKVKADKIDSLLQWLKDNPNHRFDFNTFRKNGEELLNSHYPCIFLSSGKNIPKAQGVYPVSYEAIERAEELANTQLFHIPVIILVDQVSLTEMKSNIQYLHSRKDVCQNQLFFIIHQSLNRLNLEQTIQELGIEKPQIITGFEDRQVEHYLEIYPVSDRISRTIKLLRKQEADIAQCLSKRNEESMASNRGIHRQIDELEKIIKRLKETLELFSNQDNFSQLSEMRMARTHLFNSIQNWKSKKIKITKEAEAISLTQDLEQQANKFYMEFCKKIEMIFQDVQNTMENDYETWYQRAEYEVDFVPDISRVQKAEYRVLPAFAEELLKMKEEKYVRPKEDLFGMLFKSSDDKEVVPVLETTFYCQEWRDYTLGLVEPLVNELIQESEAILGIYAAELARSYRVQLRVLISEQTEIRDNISAQLSDEELKLQRDHDWLAEFGDQIRLIEDKKL